MEAEMGTHRRLCRPILENVPPLKLHKNAPPFSLLLAAARMDNDRGAVESKVLLILFPHRNTTQYKTFNSTPPSSNERH